MGFSSKGRLLQTHRSAGYDTDKHQDEEMWLEDGDCTVHYYARGSSQRGPSLKVPFSAVQTAGSDYLLKTCLSLKDNQSSPVKQADSRNASPLSYTATYELYVPAPAHLTREQIYAYHVTTRNYFAYLTGRPALVGEKLGAALADLYVRVQEWHQDDEAIKKLLVFCEDQGYMHLAENTHYATAVLNLAEKARLRDLYIHAFVHCVGMHDRLERSPEFDSLSNVTKAVVTRASLEMELHIARVVRAFGGFLEEELGTENLGLSKAARNHLDRFRTFLHAHYLEKLGYFPPSDSEPFDKPLWMSMYNDFHGLYKYLVDHKSTHDMATNWSPNGGVCVLQNVHAFDARHGYEPLPHPQPLLPQAETRRRTTDAQKTLRGFRLGRTESAVNATPRASPRVALANATNTSDPVLLELPIVQEYQRFERQKLEDKLSDAEARKVRWLLIYGVLQMVISVTRAPVEVKDVEAASYPLCVLTDGCPPWEEEETPSAEQAQSATQSVADYKVSSDNVERMSIHPDCEADNAQDYFSLSRSSSSQALDQMAPPPLRITVPLSRTASIRSSVHTSVNALHRSVAGSFTRRNSRRYSTSMTVPTPPGRKLSHYEIVVAGYGNGADAEEEAERPNALARLENAASPQTTSSFADFDFGLNPVAEDDVFSNLSPLHYPSDVHVHEPFPQLDYEPVLEASQLNFAPSPLSSTDDSFAPYISSSSGSSISDVDSPISYSTRSSYASSCDTPATDDTSMELSPSPSTSTILGPDKSLPIVPVKKKPVRAVRASYAQKYLNFGVSSSCTSLSAGCYTPKGMPQKTFRPAVSRFAPIKREESVDSTCSSVYAGGSIQADEIEEEESRGRRRSRALDSVISFSLKA
jgi:hypothetical protein